MVSHFVSFPYSRPHVIFLAAMKILDPNLRDGVYEWRDGRRYVKEGDKLFLEGTSTLAGRRAAALSCINNRDSLVVAVS